MEEKELKVKITKLKQFVLEKLPPNSPLRDIILAEKDEQTKEEFMAKLKIWQILVKKEN